MGVMPSVFLDLCIFVCNKSYEYMTEDCVWSKWIKTEPSRCLAFAFAE